MWGNNEINGNNASDFINIVTAGTERMRIIANGNVGIGTSAPVTTLDVGGSLSGGQGVVGKEMLVSQTLNTAYNGASSGSWGGLMLNNNNSSTSVRTATGLHFTHGTSGVAGIVSTSTASQRADIRFITRGSGNAVAERVIINDDGYVGIGVSSPSNKLHVDDCIMVDDMVLLGGSPFTGDFDVGISNLPPLDGNSWKRFGLLLSYSGIQDDAGGAITRVAYIRIGGLSTWNSTGVDNILGSTAISFQGSSTTSLTFKVTTPSNTCVGAYSVTLAANGTTTLNAQS